MRKCLSPDRTDPSLWPPDLEAPRAAPAQHRVILENERVCVLDTRIAPGERTPVHTHRWPAVHHVTGWSASSGATRMVRCWSIHAPPVWWLLIAPIR
jgi:hypothetical protein